MDASSFSIVEAVRNGYRFTFRESGYLLKIVTLPFLVHMITSFVLQAKFPEASTLWLFIINLPANILFAWFLFLEARLLLLGERIDRLPQDPRYLGGRRQAMQASIIVLLLFNMAFTTIAATMEWLSKQDLLGKNSLVTLLVLFVVGGMIWGLRLGLAHILAAVGYSIQRYIYRVDGVLFSFRLIGMGLLSALPVFVVFQVLLALVVPDPKNITDPQVYLLIALGTPLSFLMAVVLNAAGAYALKDMLSRPDPREGKRRK